MNTCKECVHYNNQEGEHKGTCMIMGLKRLISNNSTITDCSEDDLQPYYAEVGENFGCIHFDNTYR